jgi:dihydroorotate dehydrogenase electron transfer subunit
MPPVHELSKELPDAKVLLGFRSEEDMFCLEHFSDPVVVTEDGSFGEKGLVTDVMDRLDFDYVMCCGPEPMLKAVYEKAIEKNVAGGQFSFEERMGCGFGACMGCSCKTKYGYKRICKDGPVLDMEEIVW